jgi:NAD(P)-dependent dehydrogenase (short-subunit alcohol dehydrogenase family)
MRLKPGHIAIVTGVAGGIGLAVCKALLVAGLSVCAVEVVVPAHDRPGTTPARVETRACGVSQGSGAFAA